MKKTQVILLQRMKNLGFIGDVVSVKPGYARNFLFPKKIALRASEENKAYFEEKRDYFEAYNKERLAQAETSANEMKDYTLTIVRRASSNGHLYGSVSARDLVDYFAEKGIKIKQHQIVLPKPLKEIGVFNVTISFHADVETNVFVNIARSEQEGNAQIAEMMSSSQPSEDTTANNASTTPESSENNNTEENQAEKQ